MKKIIVPLLFLAISGVSARAQNEHPKAATLSAPAQHVPEAGKFKFAEDTHDYGEVPEGPLAECDFVFTNVGDKPISINEAHGSCGCTVPEWPHQPVKPGDKGVIHVKYATTGRPGPISKEVTINSDAQQSPMVLHIKGTVKPAAKAIPPKDGK